MQGRSYSLRDRTALHLALAALVCVALGLLSGNSPARLAGTDWSTRQIDNRVGQIEALNHTAMPMGSLDMRPAEDLLDELVEPAEATDDDETDEDKAKACISRSGLAAFAPQTGRHESPVDRAAITPFRLLAFPTRGSPSA